MEDRNKETQSFQDKLGRQKAKAKKGKKKKGT